MGKKKTPGINSSSTADIAFLLLCYFLMTTTMGDQAGLQRRLPPIPDNEKKAEDQKPAEEPEELSDDEIQDLEDALDQEIEPID